jgi:hypothetical protein
MTTTEEWLIEARKRVCQPCNVEAYSDFLATYWRAENGQRTRGRRQHVRLGRNWKLRNLSSKAIVVVGENGIGDEVLTIGCLADLQKEYATVYWKCDPKLKDLFSRSFSSACFITKEDDPSIASPEMIYSWQLIGCYRRC